MPQDQQYSQQFDYAIRMLEEIGEYPILAQQLVQTTFFKDFQTTLKMYEIDIHNKKNDAG